MQRTSLLFSSLPLLFSLASLGAAACSVGGKPVAMHDDFELDLLGPRVDDLHSPYVAGATFGIDVEADPKFDTTHWTFTSSDPSILSLDVTPPVAGAHPVGMHATAHATASGHATLQVFDEHHVVVDMRDVDVGVPDSVALYAHGLLLAGESDATARIDRARVVAGGEATFLVRYFAGGTELSGAAAIAPQARGPATATSATSTFSAARDWIRVSAGATTGTGTLDLVVGGRAITTVPFSVVAPTAVTRIGIAKQDDSEAKDGAALSLFGRAFDEAGDDVYGASFGWSVDGAKLGAGPIGDASPSDVLTYRFKSSANNAVTARLGDASSSSVSIHAAAGSSAVGSTATVGCSLDRAPGRLGAPGGFALALAALTATLARRRRGAARA